MAKFQAQETLLHNGKLVAIGGFVELEPKNAERLGDKVVSVEEAEITTDAVYDEATFAALTADQQKAVVEGYGGDLKEVSNADKRWAFVAENQQ